MANLTFTDSDRLYKMIECLDFKGNDAAWYDQGNHQDIKYGKEINERDMSSVAKLDYAEKDKDKLKPIEFYNI